MNTKAITYDYCLHSSVPVGWWHLLQKHVEELMSADPKATMYIVQENGGLRVDTFTLVADKQFGTKDTDLFFATLRTCPYCGKEFRERPKILIPWAELCPQCDKADLEKRMEIQLETAKRWFNE